jgi:CRP-like cAMP-binding protein
LTDFRKYLNLLSPITEETWQKISSVFMEKTLKKGDYFAKNGEKAVHIGYLKSGVVRAFYTNSEGVDYNKHFFLPNSLVGAYASLISGNVNLIAQQALTDCQILVADYAHLTNLYDTCAEQRYAIFQKQYPNLEQIITQYHIASFLGITPTQLSRIRNKLSKK